MHFYLRTSVAQPPHENELLLLSLLEANARREATDGICWFRISKGNYCVLLKLKHAEVICRK